MESLLFLFLIIPLLGFLTGLVFPQRNEKAIFLAMSITAFLQTIFAIGFTFYWAVFVKIPLNIKEIVLYNSEHYKFFIDLYFDDITATYLIMSSVLTFMIAHFSRGYMHKDDGYKRYFNNMMLYFFGVQVIIFSGNFETLFIGWEILGLSSFLLIAYYRNRYLPVRNGFKVFSMYRIADVGILASMWLLHHLFHENVTFIQLSNQFFVQEHIHHHYLIGVLISAFIILAALVKSAQFPFSSWLPRAMEGPTPSSSIFYGSIAIHIGIYLLLRTFPFWSQMLEVRIAVICIGLISGFIASSIAKVQFSIKAQIGYSSIAQIGIMIVEVALGLEWLVLIHMTGNAFLRAYQLLVSPSVVTYKLRDQFFNYEKEKVADYSKLQLKLRNTMYVLALKEFYMDNYIYKYLWFPFKRLGHKVSFLNTKFGISVALIGLLVSSFLFRKNLYEHIAYHHFIPNIIGIIALIFVLRAFTIRKHPFGAWTLLVINHFWISLAVSFNEHFSYVEIIYYLGGVVVAGIGGYIVLKGLRKIEYFNLDDYYGHAIEHPKRALLFLIFSLTLMGFPISSTFIGEDLLFSHIHIDQVFLISIILLNFALAGIAIMRIYARVFMGPNHKWNKAEARRTA